jgi:sorting nexin-1/2
MDLVSKHRLGESCAEISHLVLLIRFPSEMATATGEFAQSLSDLSSSDVGRQLSQSLAGLADVVKKAEELQKTQAEQDVITLMGTGT